MIVFAPVEPRYERAAPIFDYLRGAQKAKGPHRSTALQIAEIFVRLRATRLVKAKVTGVFDVKSAAYIDREEEHPAGLWIADSSQWSSRSAVRSEHPWDDADELFASAREAFLVDRRRFEANIKRFAKFDPKVSEPAGQLLAVLDALSRGEEPNANPIPSNHAERHLSKIPPARPAEETLDSSLNDTLRWALDPSTWPFDR